MKRYTLVAGNCINLHRGGVGYTGLRIVGHYDTLDQTRLDVEHAYQESSGLVLLIDNETGKEQNEIEYANADPRQPT